MYRRTTTILTTTMMLSLAACAVGGPGDGLDDENLGEMAGDGATPHRYVGDDGRLSESAQPPFDRDPAGATQGPSRRDRDGDGFDNNVDCAPDDPYVHPRAPEICNGKDDDCDGRIDEADRSTDWPVPDPLESEMHPISDDSSIDAILIQPDEDPYEPFSPHNRTWFHSMLDHDYYYWNQKVADDDPVAYLQCRVIHVSEGMTVDIQLGYTLDEDAKGGVVDEVRTCSASSENDICTLPLPDDSGLDEVAYTFLAGVLPGEGVNTCANQYQLECWLAETAE